MLFNILRGFPNMETLSQSDGPVHDVTIGEDPVTSPLQRAYASTHPLQPLQTGSANAITG